jgi:hypothetical protein
MIFPSVTAKGGYSKGGYSKGGYSKGGYSFGGYSFGGYSFGGYSKGGYSLCATTISIREKNLFYTFLHSKRRPSGSASLNVIR